MLSGHFGVQFLFLCAQFGGEFGTEVFGLKHLADFDVGFAIERVGAALDPFDRLGQ